MNPDASPRELPRGATRLPDSGPWRCRRKMRSYSLQLSRPTRWFSSSGLTVVLGGGTRVPKPKGAAMKASRALVFALLCASSTAAAQTSWDARAAAAYLDARQTW